MQTTGSLKTLMIRLVVSLHPLGHLGIVLDRWRNRLRSRGIGARCHSHCGVKGRTECSRRRLFAGTFLFVLCVLANRKGLGQGGA